MAVVPTGTIEDHHGMGVSGDLAADLAEVMVHRGGIADRHDQRRRLARRRADRTKHVGRGEAWEAKPDRTAQRENIEQLRSWGYAAEWITLRQVQELEPDIDPTTIGD